MLIFTRLIFVFVIGIFFTLDLAIAQDEGIKYSLGPRCNGEEVTCDANEVPVCLELTPTILVSDGNQVENYYPSCENSYSPKCIRNDGSTAPNNIVLSCVEFVNCEVDENKNQIAKCSNEKEAICLGNSNELSGCNCTDGSPAICEYKWQISNVNSLY